jgi:flagellar protein FlaJ
LIIWEDNMKFLDKLFKKKDKKKVKKFEEQDVYSFANSVFNEATLKFPALYKGFDHKLRVARIRTTGKKYGSFIILTAFLVFVISLIFLFAFGTALYGLSILPTLAYFGIAILIGFCAGALAYFYPDILINDRKSKLDNSLPFATIYLSTIIKSGLPPQQMFKMLAKFKHYRIASEEAERISNDIHVLGLDMPSALARAMKRSPSLNWTEMLAGLKNSVTVGGDVSRYLEEKSKGFIAEYKRRLADFSNVLSLFMNMYITVVIVGIVFFIIISSLMVTVGGVPVATVKFLQYATVFIGLPGITGMFILLIKSLSPWSE